MRVFTIGFTKKSARYFFELLKASDARRVVDVRLGNVSQLAGFAKGEDLSYFLEKICDMGYVHVPELAPTREILDSYKKRKGSWERYEQEFLALLTRRRVEASVAPEVVADGCLLCSEDEPDHCHRRLVAEYLQRCWGDIEIRHLR
jgi:uncharacterized protein (DUF488 family)